MKKILFLISFLLIGCGGEIYYLDSFNYSQSGEATYETKELEAENLEGAFTEAYEIIEFEGYITITGLPEGGTPHLMGVIQKLNETIEKKCESILLIKNLIENLF